MLLLTLKLVFALLAPTLLAVTVDRILRRGERANRETGER